MAYPTDLDTFTTHNTGDVIEASYDNAQQVAISALEAKVGVDSSAVTTSHDYKLSGVTGSDKAVSKTGTETLTNKTLTSPTITSPTLNLGSDAEGDTYYRNSSGALVRLARGTDNYIYKMNGNVPNWEAEATIGAATDTTAGIGILATAAQITSGTASESSYPLLITPDQLALSTPVFNASGLTNIPEQITHGVNADERYNTYTTLELPMIFNTTTASTEMVGWTLVNVNSTSGSTMYNGLHRIGSVASANFSIASKALWGTGSNTNYDFSQTKTIKLKCKMRFEDTLDRKGFGLVASAATIYTAQTDTTNTTVRFILNGSTMYAHNSNGSTATSTDVSSGITFTNWNTYEIVFTPGTDAKFYINGTLVATHTTNLPATGTPLVTFGADANGRAIIMTYPVVSIQN